MSLDWNQRYAEGDTGWDNGAPAPALLELLRRRPELFSGRVLVPGCGRGHDLPPIAARPPVDEVIGLDLAPRALAQAAQLHGELADADKLGWREGDLLDPTLPSQLGHFDGLWEHTCLCALDPSQRSDYTRAIAALLRPGGCYAAIFYLNPGFGHEEGPPFGIAKEELDALFAEDFELVELNTDPPQYPGRTGVEQGRLYRRRS